MSDTEEETNSFFNSHGCHLKVNNINSLKVFYRDVIGLGNPLVDSNFWVEFELPNNGLLVLEQVTNIIPDENKQDVALLLITDKFADLMAKLEDKQYELLRPAIEIPGRESLSITDPEYNVVTIISSK